MLIWLTSYWFSSKLIFNITFSFTNNHSPHHLFVKKFVSLTLFAKKNNRSFPSTAPRSKISHSTLCNPIELDCFQLESFIGKYSSSKSSRIYSRMKGQGTSFPNGSRAWFIGLDGPRGPKRLKT